MAIPPTITKEVPAKQGRSSPGVPSAEAEHLRLLYRVGISLSAEKNKNRLVEMILLEAKQLCNADGGTLYLLDDEDRLQFDILHTESLGVILGGTSGKPINLPPIPVYDEAGRPNVANVASYAAAFKKSVNIEDAYDTSDFDFSGTRRFDERNNYRSTSFLTIPLVNSSDRVIGVLQLINARDEHSGKVVAFCTDEQEIVEALASQAAIALDNQLLLDGQKKLLESFIKLIANAIDHKSPYTGGHCERVPVLADMLAHAACDTTDGPFATFSLDEEQWEELRIAAWLHDCGKITTPVHVMDKATKLETIFDRIEIVRARFEVLRREIEIRFLKDAIDTPDQREALDRQRQRALTQLDNDWAFIERVNIGSEFLDADDRARVAEIGGRELVLDGQRRRLLDPDEVENLSVSRGTLTEQERLIINGHMVQTINMLEALPFPRQLARVPEYAGGHHERMDGSGYPRGLYAGDMSIPARIMAIADVFEALTAQDRPYKRESRSPEAMRIMGFMKRDNHIDPDVFDLFVRSGVYREYGARFLPAELIDEVNEQALLEICPKPFDLPDAAERELRWRRFRDEYRAQRKLRIPELSIK